MTTKPARGLGSLLSSTATRPSTAQQGRILDLPISSVIPNPKQPRRTFGKESIEKLAASIGKEGVLQPILVRPSGQYFELIAGERRWRAARKAGLQTIRAVCREVDSAQALTLSIVENLQREDLNPIDEAAAYKNLTGQLDLTHEQVGVIVGRDRATVSNTMRLLDLPTSIQAKLVAKLISPGHGRVLLAVKDSARQMALAEMAVQGASVRELERQVYHRPILNQDSRGVRPPTPAHILSLQNQIAEKLGVKVRIKEGKRGGQLIIKFNSNQEFCRVLDIFGITNESP
jgi:ParB family transcriptional regulator, chromosome partitioning protein